MANERITFVKQLVCNVIGQALGQDYYPTNGSDPNKNLMAVDTWKLADVGKDVEELSKKDVFTKTLMIQLGKYYFDNRLYSADLPPIFRDTMEYGGYILRTRLGLYEVEDDPKWNLTNGKDYSADEHTPVLPKTYAKLFEELKALRIKYTMYNDTLTEAMTSWEMMDKFIAQIEVAYQNTVTVMIEAISMQLVCSAIAISDKATGTARHLLTEAKAKGLIGKEATADDFLKSEACIKYALMEIKKTKSYMKKFTVAFNNKTTPSFTPVEDNELMMLTSFTAQASNVLASVYHNNEFDLGDFYETPWWQATATDVSSVQKFNDITTNSAVKITADETNKLGIGTEAYNGQYIIGLMYDRLAIGIAERAGNKVTSSYTACADFWNMFDHHALNAWVDSAYNIVAFIID